MGILNKNVMKKMMALAFVGIALSGCQKKDDSTAIQVRVGTSRLGGGTIPPEQAGITIAGRVSASSAYQDAFQKAVYHFMSAGIADVQQVVGYVSATGEGGTGVYFGGRVISANGTSPIYGNTYGNNMNSYAQSALSPQSSILVQVKDYWQNQQPAALPSTYMMLDPNYQSYIQGNRAVLRFADQYQVIEMDGTINNQYYTGSFRFITLAQKTSSGQMVGVNAEKWAMGDFSIPVCNMFVCQ